MVLLVSVAAVIGLAGRLGKAAPRETQQPSVSAGDPTPVPVKAPPVPTRQVSTDATPLPEILVDPRVLVEKDMRRLTVFSDGVAVKRYRIALGTNPVGDKEREGDGRTPEGDFYICSKNAASKFHRSLGLSYPSEEDADRGLADGIITKRDHRAIVTALHRMERPPWKTKLGGEIMIHGAGATRGDWTRGCIALDDRDAEELFVALPMGTPVTIVP